MVWILLQSIFLELIKFSEHSYNHVLPSMNINQASGRVVRSTLSLYVKLERWAFFKKVESKCRNIFWKEDTCFRKHLLFSCQHYKHVLQCVISGYCSSVTWALRSKVTECNQLPGSIVFLLPPPGRKGCRGVGEHTTYNEKVKALCISF